MGQDKVTSFNMNDDESGGVSLQPNVDRLPTEQTEKMKDSGYNAQRSVIEKNVNTLQQEDNMDLSTPIADIMGSNEVMDGGPMGAPVDPQHAMMAHQQMVAQPQQMMHQQVPAAAPAPVAAPAAPAAPKHQLPMNLTEEQAEALLVGLVAVAVFSKPAQEKLAGFIPRFLDENGSRSLTGFAATGLVAAIAYYFGRRMVLKPNN